MDGRSAKVEVAVRVRDEGSDGYWAEVLELPGCVASGFTSLELDESLREAMELHFSNIGSPVEVVAVMPAQRDRHTSTGRHARPHEEVEHRTVEVTLH
jgi:predicted RNase H-like HicB family nuclease